MESAPFTKEEIKAFDNAVAQLGGRLVRRARKPAKPIVRRVKK